MFGAFIERTSPARSGLFYKPIVQQMFESKYNRVSNQGRIQSLWHAILCQPIDILFVNFFTLIIRFCTQIYVSVYTSVTSEWGYTKYQLQLRQATAKNERGAFTKKI